MQQVLLVEDSEECQIVVKRALASQNAKLICASSLSEARNVISNCEQVPIHLIILDFGLPDGDGLSFLEEIRSKEFLQDIPVVFLTGSEDLNNKVTAFSLGAEDYLVKPINLIELKARIEMRLKKTEKRSASEVVRKGNLVLQMSLMRTSIIQNGKESTIDLTGKEFKILAFLAKNEGKVYSRDELVKMIWGPSVHVLARTVDSHVCGLRKKMMGLAEYIECIPNVGYRFTVKSLEKAF